ncbi:MAG: carboxypeptidase-like regulatory domain-containing protein [Acidobacteriia bacterium]|nr:carboxypeptidase-like regulatory domain-containing protein [Terriglobia bacterium]
MSNRLIFCLWLTLTLCSYAEAQVGVIKGFVVDEQGKRVPGAQVNWQRIMPKGYVEVYGTIVPSSTSDDQGHFSINGLAEGESYKVYAQKEESYYPDMTVGLYNPKDDASIVTAQTADKATDVTVRLGPKAGRLSWQCKDAITGLPMHPTLSVKRTDSGDGFGGGVGHSFLIPADTDVTLTVEARGYQTWYYPGTADKKQSAPLRVGAGEQKLLEIQLERQK